MWSIASTLLYPLMFVLVISVVIVIHELGHYWAGRYFGAAVESFSMGFGGSIFEVKDKNNTRWRLNWLPLGGFVNFVGEGGVIENEGHPHDTDEAVLRDERKTDAPIGRPFMDLSAGARNVVALAGPFANFILAIVVFAGLAMFLGNSVEEVKVAGITENSPAAASDLQIDDIFLTVNGRQADHRSVILEEIKLSAGTPVDLQMRRGEDVVDLTITPRRETRKNVLGIKERTGMIGVEMRAMPIDRQKLGPIRAVGHGVEETFGTISTSIEMLGRILTGKESLQQLSGPVGIANVAGGMAKSTLEVEGVSLQTRLTALLIQSINLIAFISVAVGFFNLIPLPILDGGVVVLNTYEAVTGKGLPEEIVLKTKFATVILLAVLAIFITVGDIEESGLLELFGGL